MERGVQCIWCGVGLTWMDGEEECAHCAEAPVCDWCDLAHHPEGECHG